MFEWLENTGIAGIVQESVWGYPIVLSAHAVGMAILVGIALMINLRILGLASAIPLPSLRPMYKVAAVGLVINVVSGTLLFMANATAFVQSTPFLIKIGLLVIGGILLAILPRLVFSAPTSAGNVAIGSRAKATAVFSTVIWIGVIISGRLIAYVDVAFY